MLWLTRQSLKRPPITMMLAIVMIIGGLVASGSLKQELFPDISFPVVSVTTIYPGASAEVLDHEVTEPLEKALSGIPGVEGVQSSSAESFAFTVVQFDVDADVKEAKANVQDKVASLVLPEGAQQPKIGTFDFNSLPILIASISGDDLAAIQADVEADVLPALSSIAGVSNVSISGGTQDKVLITLDPDKLTEHNLTQAQVVQFLQANNLVFPVGTVADEGRSLPLRVTHTYSSTDEIGNVVVGIKCVNMGSLAGGGDFNSAINAECMKALNPTAPVTPTTPLTTTTAVTQSLIPAAMQGFGITTPEQITPDVIAQFPEANLSIISLPLALVLSDESQTALAERLPEPEIGPQLQSFGITAPAQITPEVIAQFPAAGLAQFPVNLALALPEASQGALAAKLATTPAAPAEASTNGSVVPAEFAAFGITTPEQITPDVIAQVPAPALVMFTPELTAALTPESQAALEARKANPSAPAVASVPDNMLIRLKDIGTVDVGSVGGATVTRTNTEPSITIEVFRESTGNTVEIVDDVKAEFANIEAATKDSGNPITFKIVREQATPVIESISAVTSEGLIGAVVAIIVIFLFLRSLRSTLVTAVSIPLSVLAALVLIRLQGFSLNVMTLGGLTVAVGRVVDDSIVVLENIYRHINRGDDINTSVIEGTREVAGAITSSTLTTVCVFLPLGVVGGIVSKFFLPFALTVTYALLASLVVSLTIVPLLARMFIRRSAKGEEKETWMQKAYTPILRWSLKNVGTKLATLGIALGLLIGSGLLAQQLKFTFLPDNSDKNILISLAMPAGTALDTTSTETSKVEDLLKPYRDDGRVRDLQTLIGKSGSGQASDNSGGATAGNVSRITLSLNTQNTDELVKMTLEIEQKIKAMNTFEAVVVQTVAADGGGPAGSGLDLVLVSPDIAKLREANAKIMAEFGGNKAAERFAVVNVTSNLAEIKPELKVSVDPQKAIAHGTTTAQIALQVRALLNGERAGSVTLDGNPNALDLFVQVDNSTFDVEALKNLPVGVVNPVALEEVATVEVVDGASTISRINGDRSASLKGQFATDNTIKAQSDFEQAIKDLGLPEGVEIQAGAQAKSQTETFSDMGLALLVALVLVYVVMVLTFGSLTTPLVILSTFPLAIIGAVLGLYVTGKPLGITSLIGVLMLIGIVVTNAIVLLELVEQYRERGMNIYDSLVRAGRVRLRPILMTAIATMVALVPLAMGLKKGGFIAADLAVVVIGGLFTSTFLTLVVVPVIYSLIEGLKLRIGIKPVHGPAQADAHAEAEEMLTA